MARKTHTSSEVKTRWMDKAYRKYVVSLRFDMDQELIDYIEEFKGEIGTTQIIREALEMYVASKKG